MASTELCSQALCSLLSLINGDQANVEKLLKADVGHCLLSVLTTATRMAMLGIIEQIFSVIQILFAQYSSDLKSQIIRGMCCTLHLWIFEHKPPKTVIDVVAALLAQGAACFSISEIGLAIIEAYFREDTTGCQWMQGEAVSGRIDSFSCCILCRFRFRRRASISFW